MSQPIADRHREKSANRNKDDGYQLRKAAATIISEGSSSPNAEAWDTLIRGLKASEPAIRHFAIISIDKSFCPVPAESAVGHPTRREITLLLSDIVTNDISEQNRSLAAVVIGRIAGSLGLSIPSIAKDGFSVCLRHFLLLQSERHVDGATRRSGYETARCYAIYALTKMVEDRIDIPTGEWDRLSPEIMAILETPEQSRDYDCLRANAIMFLSSLPSTLRNRQRTQPFWVPIRPVVHRLIAGAAGPDHVLTVAVSRFVSQWYGRVPDAILDRFPLYDQLSGYSELQYSFLMNSEKEGVSIGRTQLREDTGACAYLGIVERDDVLSFIKRYSRRMQIVDVLPEKFDLTFQATGMINSELFFDNGNMRRTLHLTNRSAKLAHRFTVQIVPSRFFTVSPAFGEIPPHSSIPINITFARVFPFEKGISRGYLRLRSWTGFAFERIALRFYNGPFLQIVNSTVNFGPCPIGRRFTRRLFIKNIGINPIVCSIDLTRSSPNTGPEGEPGEKPPDIPSTSPNEFDVFPRSNAIAPSSIVGFDIVFIARRADRVESQLLVSGVGHDGVHEVLLSGSGGFPIKVLESVIDMGPCLLNDNAATAINICNTAQFPILVQFDATIDDLVIPSVIIAPGQTRTVPVNWFANRSGSIDEIVYIRAPPCDPLQIGFVAFVGPVLTTPFQHLVRMPFVSVHMTLQTVIPVHNHSRYDAEFVIDGLDGSPFYTIAVDPVRHARDREYFANDCAGKPATNKFKEALCQSREKRYIVKAQSMIFLQVVFSTHKPGFFDREFVVRILAPRVSRWAPFTLRAAATLDNEKFPLKKLLLFFGDVTVFKSSELTRLPSKDYDGAIESRMIYGDTWEGIPSRNETFAFHSSDEWGWVGRPLPDVVVENLSARPHNFSMLVTYPFLGANARHGICGAYDRLAIPSTLTVDDIDHLSPLNGFIIIRDNFAKTSMCQLHLLATHLVAVADALAPSRLVFATVDVDIVSSLPFTVVNRSGIPVWFRLAIQTDGLASGDGPPTLDPALDHEPLVQSIPDPSPSTESDRLFFYDHSSTAKCLGPWERRTILLKFRSAVQGRFIGRLQVIYDDPLNPSSPSSSTSQSGPSSTRSSFVSYFADLIAIAGKPDVSASVDVLDFGNCGVGSCSDRDLVLSNSSSEDVLVDPVINDPFSLSTGGGGRPIRIASRSSTTIVVSFRPTITGRFWERIQFVCGDSVSDVILFGDGGVMSLVSHLGPGRHLPPSHDHHHVDDNEINMGAVRVCISSTRVFRLINNGTIDIVVSDIVVSADDGLSYVICDNDLGESGGNDLPVFGHELLDGAMVDWDEVAYQATYADALPQSLSTDDARFPRVLPPGATLLLQLSFSRYLTGVFRPTLQVHTANRSAIGRFLFTLRFNVQDVMEINESRLDFGTVPCSKTGEVAISFHNDCAQAVSWRLDCVDTIGTHVTDRTRLPVRKDVFTASPSSGSLAGGADQRVTIRFTSNLPHCLCTAFATLQTSDIGQTRVELTAVCGAPRIAPSDREMAFGCISLGSNKSRVLTLSNDGELPAAFIVRVSSKRFHVVPVRGVIAGRSRQAIWVKFQPADSSEVLSDLRVEWGDPDRIDRRFDVALSGCGGNAQIAVKVSSIDFGLAMRGTATTRPLTIYNSGTAEALVEIDLPDPSLSCDSGPVFFVEPASSRDLLIVFRPATAVAINATAFVVSKESPGQERIPIAVRGRVGVPCLEPGPVDLINANTLNMGICMVRRQTTRQFFVDNTGNMDVPFQVVIYRYHSSSSTSAAAAARHDTDDHAGPDRVQVNDDGAGNPVQTVRSQFPRWEPQDAQWPSLIDHLVVAEPDHFQFEPVSGVFARGSRVHFTARFAPPRPDQFLDVLVHIGNPSIPLAFVASALSDEPAIDIDIPERVLDFGLCRCQNTFKRRFRVLNKGNIPYIYHLGPDIREPQWAIYRDDYESARLAWSAHLRSIGFTFAYGGTCPRRSHDNVLVMFSPTSAGEVVARVRVVCSGGYEQIDLRGVGGISHLDLGRLSDSDQHRNGDVVDFGLRPIGQENHVTLVLRNGGALRSGYLVRRTMPEQFRVFPLSGQIEGGAETPLRISFRATGYGLVQFDLEIKGIDNTVSTWRIVGRGGKGSLAIHYLDGADQNLKGIDFGLVNVGNVVEKSLVVHNDGQVDLRLWAECDDGAAFAIRLSHPPQSYKTNGDVDALPRLKGFHRVSTRSLGALLAQSRSIEALIPPKHLIVIGVGLAAIAPRKYQGLLTLSSEFNSMGVALRGQGGTIAVNHVGDLAFGSVGVDHQYERSLTITNTGTISTVARLSWQIPGWAVNNSSSTIVLTGPNTSRYAKLWRQTITMILRLIRTSKLMNGARTLQEIVDRQSSSPRKSPVAIKNMSSIMDPLLVQLGSVQVSADQHQSNIRDVESFISPTHPLFDTAVGLKNMGHETGLRLSLLQDRIEKRIVSETIASSSSSSSPITALLASIGPNLSAIRGGVSRHPHHDRDPIGKGALTVIPSSIVLDIDQPITVTVVASFPSAGAFVGSLIVTSDVLGCDPHPIRITAQAMSARLVINDGGPISFGRISLGTVEIATRVLTNNGLLPIRFTVRHRNFGLTIAPLTGFLDADENVTMTFSFRPSDEDWQRSPIMIDTDSTDTIELAFNGAGGVPKLHLASFDRFDFGRCMAGRISKKAIRLLNIGNAQLPILRCLLDQTVVFNKGSAWPTTRFAIDPDAFFDLNVEFTPQSEDVFRGRVVIETDTRVVPIELMGTGREALLTYQAHNIDLTNTIVGNVYRRELVVNNVSDLDYPIQITIASASSPDLVQDFALDATEMTLQPFEQRSIQLTYRAARQIESSVNLHMSSIYSEHDVVVPVVSGTAIIAIDQEQVEFGQFQKGHSCSRSVVIRNSGTIAVAFRIHSARDPAVLDFSLSRWKGLLVPDRDVEIIFKTTLSSLGSFQDELCLETQVDGQRHYIHVRGRCDTPIIDPSKFQRVDFGDCLVGETATQSFVIDNSGGYPLTYRMKAIFPIKVIPSSGSVQALSRQRFVVQWVPSGGYGLRSTVKAHTNMGVYDINIKGRGAYPRFTISNAFLDFGVGAIKRVYEQRFKLINRGKVGIRFSIPYGNGGGGGTGQIEGNGDSPGQGKTGTDRRPDEVSAGYIVSPMRGALAAGETVVVKVRFEPREYRKYVGNIVVESKGRYREVVLVGAGGVLRLDHPDRVDMGNCPSGYWRTRPLSISNTGDVPLTLHIAGINLQHGFALIPTPETVTLSSMEHQMILIRLRVDPGFSGKFEFGLALAAHERTWKICVSGNAVNLIDSFTHLTEILMRSDAAIVSGPVALQQWPNALEPDLVIVPPPNPYLGGDRSPEAAAVASVVRMLVNGSAEMMNSGTTIATTFQDRLVEHIEGGSVRPERDCSGHDRVLEQVLVWSCAITRPEISTIVSVREPDLVNIIHDQVIAAPPVFLPELTYSP